MKDFSKEDNFSEMAESKTRRSRKRAATQLFINGTMSSLDYGKVGKAVARAKAHLGTDELEVVDDVKSTDFPIL